MKRQRMVYRVSRERWPAWRQARALLTLLAVMAVHCPALLALLARWVPPSTPQLLLQQLAASWMAERRADHRSWVAMAIPDVPAAPCCQQAIWQELTEAVHAVDAMVTKTPEEAGLAPDSVGPPPKAQTSNRGSGAADD